MNTLIDPKFAVIIKNLPVKDHTVVITSKKLLPFLPAGPSLSRSYLLGQAPCINLLTEIILWGVSSRQTRHCLTNFTAK